MPAGALKTDSRASEPLGAPCVGWKKRNGTGELIGAEVERQAQFRPEFDSTSMAAVHRDPWLVFRAFSHPEHPTILRVITRSAD